jgi:hypothetical protein
MKIEGRRERLVHALETAQDVKTVVSSTPAAEVAAVLEELSPARRSTIEALLASTSSHTIAPPSAGQKAHQVRALKQPWWTGLQAPLGLGGPPAGLADALPTRDVEAHGERFSKDDVASMLRSLAR